MHSVPCKVLTLVVVAARLHVIFLIELYKYTVKDYYRKYLILHKVADGSQISRILFFCFS